MTIADGILIAGILVSVGTALATLTQARNSLRDQGKRIGQLERLQGFEEGRRKGLAEARERSHTRTVLRK